MSLTRSDNLYEDFAVGETIVHFRGRTISEGEHMMWTNFVLNTAQLHFNQKMCDDSPQTTFDGRRVVEEGLKPDEQVIVEGLMRVRPGVVVDAKPWEVPTQTALVK